MKKYIWYCFTVSLLFSSCAISQTLTPQESGRLQGVVYEFFKGPTWKEVPGAEEAFLCLLGVDSNGMINSVNFLSGKNGEDSAFKFYKSNMTPDVFKNWQSEKSQGKTIVIPIVLVPTNGAMKNVLEKAGLNDFVPGEKKALLYYEV